MSLAKMIHDEYAKTCSDDIIITVILNIFKDILVERRTLVQGTDIAGIIKISDLLTMPGFYTYKPLIHQIVMIIILRLYTVLLEKHNCDELLSRDDYKRFHTYAKAQSTRCTSEVVEEMQLKYGVPANINQQELQQYLEGVKAFIKEGARKAKGKTTFVSSTAH